MAAQEKLLKSLDVLKHLSNCQNDQSKKKDRIQHCHIITEAISNPIVKIAPNFHTYLGITIEVILQLCDDPESDVRMVAEECLNRIIRAMHDGNISKVQIELHKGIKKNGAARSLRAALWRFAQLAHFIRPHKGKPYVVHLFPIIVKIIGRNEELVHETLANSLPKILQVLGNFAPDLDTKLLLKAVLRNVNHQSAAIRRTTASCVLSICLNCRKPYIFLTYVMSHLIDLLMPMNDDHNNPLILGVMSCLKNILPHLNEPTNGKQEIKGSFGVRREVDSSPPAVDKLLQIYEICLNYFDSPDHNIVNAALETLNVLLQNCSRDLKKILLCQNGLTKSRISLNQSSSLSKLRSPSQLSVATNIATDDLFGESELTETLMTDIEKWIDESKLSVMNVTYAKSRNDLDKSVSIESGNVPVEDFEHFDYKIDDFSATKSQSIENNLERLTLSENSSEKSLSYVEDDKNLDQVDYFQDISIGSLLDKNVPLIYCARLIAKSFLLTGQPGNYQSDKIVRVSVKCLALLCISSIVKLYPNVLNLYLDKNYSTRSTTVNISSQKLSDVLLYESHQDPQLRGTVRSLISNYLKSIQVENCGNWHNSESEDLEMSYLIRVLVKGLEDESSTCSRQTLISLGSTLALLCESDVNRCALPILQTLPLLTSNPYWLVKVALCELVSKLPYITIYDVTGSSLFQNRIIFNVLIESLKHDDSRVRNSAANSLVSIIPHLYYEEYCAEETVVTTKALSLMKFSLNHLLEKTEEGDSHMKHLMESMPFPFNKIGSKGSNRTEFTLSKIISKLYGHILTSTSRHFISGCIETLSMLSMAYPTTVYTKAWNCHIHENIEPSSTADILNFSINLLRHSVTTYDLNFHLNLLNLSSNLYAGHAHCFLRPISNVETSQVWDMFSDKDFSNLSKNYLSHMVKLLNIFHYVLDEIQPVQPPTKVLSNLSQATNTLSPIKRRKSDLVDKEDFGKDRKDSKSSGLLGCFVNLPHYMRIYDTLRSAYTNYKISLDSEASEKFLGLLRQTLHTLSLLMEVGTMAEFRGIADEILGYCRSTFIFEAASTVECVQQLLKSLFGTNLTANVTEVAEIVNKKTKCRDLGENNSPSFYFNVSQKPYTEVAACFNSLRTINKIECDGDSTIMGYLHRKDVSKASVPARTSDKVLASYIRIFEPMVIKSLKQYTITCDIKMQCRVLQLLSQLIQLRVNYCLLDSEQIFINFIIKQFEYIEEGQIPFADELIPKIFQFLVHLSYSKQHSKSIIEVPKIIQLCDGLMASGQSPLTHCIPALEPIVADIFLAQNKSNTCDMKELETTREVVLSMLLRLSEYHQVVDLIVLILNDSKYCKDDPEKWLRWSGQVVSVIFPMLKQNKMRLESAKAFVSLRRLIFALNPNVFYPIDSVLFLLFKEPLSEDLITLMCNRWLAKVLIALLVLSPLREDVLFAKISEVKGDFSPGCIFENVKPTADPLNVSNGADFFSNIDSETIFVKSLFRILDFISGRCVEIARSATDDDFIVELLSVLLMYCLHIFQSGTHCKIVNYAIREFDRSQLEKINSNFLILGLSYPIVTFLWSYFLTLLNYNEKGYWAAVLQQDSKGPQMRSINSKIVRTGCVILFCDYMSEDNFDSDLFRWFLRDFVDVLIDLCEEAPVSEFISSVHRNPETSRLFIKNIIENCTRIREPIFKTKVLKCVENTNSLHIGSLLKLLLPKFLMSRQLALSRVAANLASRKIEILLTLPMEDVNSQLAKEDLLEIIKQLVSLKLVKRHEALSSLLNKLCTQYYDISPLEFDQKRPVNPEYIRKLQINKGWYLQQIKAKSVDAKMGKETAQLLRRLDYDEVYAFMTDADFHRVCFQDCLKLAVSDLTRQNGENNNVLFKAAVACLLIEVKAICKRIPQPHQVYRPWGGSLTPSELKYEAALTSLFEDHSFCSNFLDLIPSVSCYVSSLRHPSAPQQQPDDDFLQDLVKFGVLCLDAVSFIIDADKVNVNSVDEALKCCEVILKENRVTGALNSNTSWLCTAVNSLYKFVDFLLKVDEPLPDSGGLSFGFKESLDNEETKSAGRACYQLNVIIIWMHKIKDSNSLKIQKSFFEIVKSITISLSRLPLVNSYLLVPAKVWKTGWSPDFLGEFRTQVPPLPIELLQEIDILEEFIFRMTLLGWTSRQQFEETWMCLLSVLCVTPTADKDPAEVNDIVHASSLAAQAITSLLLQTLHYPQPGNTVVSELIHVSRDPPIKHDSLSIKKLMSIYGDIENEHSTRDYLPKLVSIFDRSNFEKHSPNHLSYGQMSVKYLLIATSNNNVNEVGDCEISKLWKRRERLLQNSGLDVNSCLQFLLDFYTQLLKQPSTPLRFLHEAVRSAVIISELFSDKTQFTWMLETFLELTKVHNYEEQLLHQYLIVGICKSAAVLTPDLETYECIKKMLVHDLKSTFLPARIACLHGLLYILEGCKLSNISIGGISDEMQLILPCAVEYVQCNLNSTNEVLKRCQEHTMLVWALAFFLMENVDEMHMESNFTTNTLQTAFTVLLQQKPTIILHRALMKNLERLIVVEKSVCEKIGKQIESLALEKLKSDNPSISVLGKQLLLTYMYTDCGPHFETSETSSDQQSNPDYLVQTIEKLSAIFEHIKKGYVFEIEILCDVLPDIINDFFSPSDVLTKVIGEFLSPQQPHPKLLSKVVFQVFAKAIEQQQLPLLQDWVVFSLSNFTQSLSLGMATWCLTCFFISASSNEWLRSFFPYVQTRVGRYEYEDRKMLCIAGADFYKNLTSDRQRNTFVENFNKVKDQPDTLFNDLLNSL